ncbi:MAG: hypothetical protein E7E19_05305 [Varibaculum cambriense]|nr:hypothetical protein [Varibaculum cambriense]MDU3274632.1 hypothetical protein [Varibaculum cambriense]
MIPTACEIAAGIEKMPRTCGDDPGKYLIKAYEALNAPHLRG